MLETLIFKRGFLHLLLWDLHMLWYSMFSSLLDLLGYHVSNVAIHWILCYYCMLFPSANRLGLACIVFMHPIYMLSFLLCLTFNLWLISNFSFVKFWFHSPIRVNWFSFPILPCWILSKISVSLYLDSMAYLMFYYFFYGNCQPAYKLISFLIFEPVTTR